MKKIHLKPIILVICCTIFTSLGQILWKIGSKNITDIYSIITNLPLLAGFLSYAFGAVFLIIAYKYGDMSLVYPFVALSFIWVNIASVFLFNEAVTFLNWMGILTILIGVSLIGYGSRK